MTKRYGTHISDIRTISVFFDRNHYTGGAVTLTVLEGRT